MAGLHEATEGPHKKEVDMPSASRFRISGTIVVGISLGTVSSGISYARFNPNGPTIPQCFIHTVNPHGVPGSRVDAKIPTEHLRSRFLEWFEVSLLRDEDLPSDIHHSHKFTEPTTLRRILDVSPKTVIAEYLNLLWSDFHGSLGCSMYDFKYEVVIAVPGSWPFYARQIMNEAIDEANILSDKVDVIPKFIPDIEAASIALVLGLTRPRGGVPPILKNGDLVVVCNCGSFTTESATYRISLIRPLAMQQITRGGYIFAGPALMDNAFMNLLKAKIQKSCPSFVTHLTEQRLREFTYHHWENDTKDNFCGDHREWTFPVPDRYGRDTEQTISFSAFELGLVFDPIVDEIVNLVELQIDSVTNLVKFINPNDIHVIIAGDSGHSPYVQTRIKQVVLERFPYAAFHYPPRDQGCTAAARGAVLRGLQMLRSALPDYNGKDLPYVTSRITRDSYGTALPPRNEIEWLVKEGTELSAVDPIRRCLPLEAISTHTTDSRMNNVVQVYYRPYGSIQGKPHCTIIWPSTGPKTETELDFKWDGIHMEVSVLHRGRELDGVSIQYDPNA